ncbi:DNA primase [Prauserella coralliicola]|nr:DNA primase [Prauserella coralliicola]
MSTTRDMLAVALQAARRGWHVFPLRPGGKAPVLHGREACPRTGPCADGHRGWEQRATTDPERIRAAWSRAPYNVGVATGPSGLCVIDLDTADPGEQVPQRWAAEGATCGEDVLAIVAAEADQEVPGDTFTVATPSGGWHLYYRAPEGVELRNTSGDAGRGLGWKVDTRAWGGYVVAPGSVVHGRTYRPLAEQDPAPLPGWLADRLTPAPAPAAPVAPIRTASGRRSRYLDAVIRAETARVHNAAKGERNSTLYVAAVALGQLVAGGAISADEHMRVLLTAAGRHLAAGAYSELQARKTIASGLRAGAKRPRQVA